MGLATAITAIGVGLSAVGTFKGIQAQQKANNLQKQAMDVQQRQSDLEAMRARRQVYRDMVKAQAMSEVNAAAQGGLASSALQGGLAQASSSGMQSQVAINQNQQNAQSLYRIRRASVGLGDDAAAMKSIGSGLTSLGQSKFIQTIGSFAKV